MGREMTKGEISIIAADCIRAIRANEDPVELLKAKGFDEPIKTWYDIRRWIKSNRAADYVMIPAKLRIEIPERPTETVTMAGKHGEHTFKLYGDKPAEEANPENENTEPLDEVPKDEISGFEPVEVKKHKGWPKGRPRKKVEIRADEVESQKVEIRAEEADPISSEAPKLVVMSIRSNSFVFSKTGDAMTVERIGSEDCITLTKETAEELAKAIPIAFGMIKS